MSHLRVMPSSVYLFLSVSVFVSPLVEAEVDPHAASDLSEVCFPPLPLLRAACECRFIKVDVKSLMR